MGGPGEAFNGLIQLISGKAKVPKAFVSYSQPNKRLTDNDGVQGLEADVFTDRDIKTRAKEY